MVVVGEVVADVVALLDVAERRHQPGAAAAARGAVEGPVVLRQRAEVDGLDVDRLVGVGEVVVAVEHHRVAPAVGQVERQLGQLDGLGDVHRGEHDAALVAVAAAAGGLPVVALRAGHVHDHHREPGQRQLADRLLHERQALTGRAGGAAGAGGGRAPRHAHRLELALGVHAHPTDGRELLGHVLEHLGERRHRVAGEEPAAGGDHRLGDGLGALHQSRRHQLAPVGRAGARRRRSSSPTSMSSGVSYL